MVYKVERTEAEWRQHLGPAAYKTLREFGTENPWSGAYVENDDPGIYLCRGCDTALFGSQSKFNAECGWAAFSGPITEDLVETHEDRSQGMLRTEIRCATCGSHLGYLFQDAPEELGGWRYCVNSIGLFLRESVSASAAASASSASAS
ncbi:peptide-methionine (R)-S-oxide reductase [Catenulispora sp. EB89]|uniref:peptide-methionine (R)-S-oxide reductase MsrB n=1 Tax=Catenulispora sp. EB89 TaxID=3156257 RepID=UPI003518770E